MITDRASWRIRDEAILDELVTLMRLTADEQRLLGELSGLAAETAPDMTRVFYERLLAHPNTSEYLEGVSVNRLHSMNCQWFIDLFCGVYDRTYVRSHLAIGAIHARIGLPVRYPLAMLDVVLPFGEQVARQSHQPEAAVAAFHKVLALDVAIFTQAYEDNQLRHLAEMVGGERLARRLLAGS